METSRKLIVLAMAATAAFTASAPAAMAAPSFGQTCIQPGSKYYVALTGIHIKASPNDANPYTIAKGRTFYSTDSSTNRRGWGPAGPVQLRSGVLAPQHCHLLAQHQQLGILRRLRTCQ
jgi:hypothetical protein